jgi:hemerythrin-like domain-containing protein
MSYRLDYEEPISDVVERLKQEHSEIDRKLEKISEVARNSKNIKKLKVAVSLLNAESTEILRHAVEEEARLARAIMQTRDTRDASDYSIEILQVHRRIKEFLEEQLPYLLDENSERDTRRKISEFVDLVLKHHAEEEKELFPLAVRANLASVSSFTKESR